MSARRIVYLAHSLRSDWNNGNAHFLRGLLRGLVAEGHCVTSLEASANWSYTNLLSEGERGVRSLEQFARTYPELDVRTYSGLDDTVLASALRSAEVVIVHEWSEPELIARVLAMRESCGFKAVFHDTHHRASSNPAELARLQVAAFDAVVVFGDALKRIYRERWGARRVWTLHEAADTSTFFPQSPARIERDLIWIGNWGDGERTAELEEYLLRPARCAGTRNAIVYGVRYPEAALAALAASGLAYGGYVANLDAPAAFADAACTVHVPRRAYASLLPGIPTIRVFEALACGIPLLSAPWSDAESLFSPDDLLWVRSADEATASLRELMRDPQARAQRAALGVAAVRARHTTRQRAAQLTAILDEVFA